MKIEYVITNSWLVLPDCDQSRDTLVELTMRSVVECNEVAGL